MVTLAKAVEAAGATIINIGIGWHEARPPNAATTSRCSTPTTRSAASSTSPGGSRASGHLALTDRYYLEWMNYQSRHGAEPTPEQLSTHLAAQGLLGRGGNPISPSNLRRHFLNWRIYNL